MASCSGVGRLGPVTLQHGKRLIERGPIGPSVQLEEHLPLLDLVALLEGHPPEDSAHLGLHRYRLERLDRSGGR